MKKLILEVEADEVIEGIPVFRTSLTIKNNEDTVSSYSDFSLEDGKVYYQQGSGSYTVGGDWFCNSEENDLIQNAVEILQDTEADMSEIRKEIEEEKKQSYEDMRTNGHYLEIWTNFYDEDDEGYEEFKRFVNIFGFEADRNLEHNGLSVTGANFSGLHVRFTAGEIANLIKDKFKIKTRVEGDENYIISL